MKQCLADVNVWFALLVRQHQHHHPALRWFDDLAPSEAGLYRFIQLALIRLLTNRSILGEDAVSALTAWELIVQLLEDERVVFLPDPPQIDSFLPALLRYSVPTSKLVSDVYIAAFALSTSRTLVTLDRGFRQFRDLKLEFLNH
jgi:uncharacterized protein